MLKKTYKFLRSEYITVFFLVISVFYFPQLNEAWLYKRAIILVFCGFLFFYISTKDELRISQWYWYSIPVILFYFICSIFYHNVLENMYASWSIWPLFCIPFLIHTGEFHEKTRFLKKTVVWVIILVSVISLWNYMQISRALTDLYSSGTFYWNPSAYHMNQFFHNHNLLAIVAALCIPLVWQCYSGKLRIVLFSLLLAVIVCSGCNNAIIGVFIWVAWMLLKKYPQKVLFLAVTGIIAVMIFYQFYPEKFQNFYLNHGAHRMVLWTAAFNVFKDNYIIGTGPGNFTQMFLVEQSEMNITGMQQYALSIYPHNTILEIAGATGIIGLFFHCASLFGLCRTGKWRSDYFSGIVMYSFMALSGYLTNIAHAEFLFFFYASGITVNSVRTVKNRRIFRIFCVAAGAGIIFLSGLYFLSNVYYTVASDAFNQAEYDKAEKYAQFCINLNPGNPLAYSVIAEIQIQKKNFSGAAMLYESALQKNPGMIRYHYKIGNLFQEEKRYNDALEKYRYYEKRVPLDMRKDVWERLCELYARKKSWNHSMKYFELLKNMFPDSYISGFSDYAAFLKFLYKPEQSDSDLLLQ